MCIGRLSWSWTRSGRQVPDHHSSLNCYPVPLMVSCEAHHRPAACTLPTAAPQQGCLCAPQTEFSTPHLLLFLSMKSVPGSSAAQDPVAPPGLEGAPWTPMGVVTAWEKGLIPDKEAARSYEPDWKLLSQSSVRHRGPATGDRWC